MKALPGTGRERFQADYVYVGLRVERDGKGFQVCFTAGWKTDRKVRRHLPALYPYYHF